MISANGTYYPPGTIYTTATDVKWKYLEGETWFKCRCISGSTNYLTGSIHYFDQTTCSLYKETYGEVVVPKSDNFKSLYDKLR